MRTFGFDASELKLLRSLDSPRKIQDFLGSLKMNFETEPCQSPRMILHSRKAFCMEGALFAAAALRVHGHPPLVLDLTADPYDFDHVVALYRVRGFWGAISKTNHPVLRFRDPIYKTIRELALSFFHEYFLDDGRKTLRSFSGAVNLARFDAKKWMTDEKDVSYIPDYLCTVRHIPFLTRWQIKTLRKADRIEREAGKLVEWTKTGRKGRVRPI